MLNQFKTSINQALHNNREWQALLQAYQEERFPLDLHGPRGAWMAAILANLASETKDSVLVITPDETEAQNLFNDLCLFTDKLSYFPWWGSMLYRGVSPQAAIFGKRAGVLSQLAVGEKRLVVCSLRAALGRLPPRDLIQKFSLSLRVGAPINPVELEEKLQQFGYLRVPRVSVPGEFALRGEVLDVAPLGEETAFRVVFAWDEVEEIRPFDILSQASSGNLEQIRFHSLREIIWDEERLRCLDKSLAESEHPEIFDALRTGRGWRGEELFYPLAFEEKTNLQDYLGDHSLRVFFGLERLELAEKTMLKEYDHLYNKAQQEGLAVPPPHRLVETWDSFFQAGERRLICRSFQPENATKIYQIPCEPGRSFFGNTTTMKEELLAYAEKGYEIFVFAESESQSQRIAYFLRDDENLRIGAAPLSAGFLLHDAKIWVLQESEIFGRRRRQTSTMAQVKSAAIESFIELEPGDLVVHLSHGIGRFLGIKRMKASGAERDYINLQYHDEENIFIPIEQVNLIQRYIGEEGRRPRIDRIGGSSWEKRKAKVKKAVAELADRLVKLYARRQTSVGYAFPPDDDFQLSFEAAFPWQETEDQLIVIDEVKRDMETPQPMDRLICGDVGYGKTEIAMRAAFKAVIGGRQVAYLCPTTILAEQHHENFVERFKRFPVTVVMLSRFVATKERQQVLEGLARGDIDIVIATHRLLSQDVRFKNLGLFIVDEEQRFGVKDKERLKEMKSSIDCLSLSATPIPRTLHMSLVKIRDMSLLKTAPSNRHPIETSIQKFDADLIARAIRREVDRGGQVFFLHNRIESLERIRIFLHELVPEVFIEIAHGQMNPRQLEDIMHRFVHGDFQVLISTTIIENGIDIPNVNTIIIDRADVYGISQLYQLRGRVGRSGRLAYAFLLYPDNREISELAMKRLQIISDFTELGSGFKIAMKDLEVRGSGNLLGAEQSGNVYAVGFELYLRLLEDAVKARSAEEKEEEFPEPYLDLDYSGFIPNTYIRDESEKMELYKKIAAVGDEADLERLHLEIHDRFGPLPDEVLSLISLAEIRVICRKLRIKDLKERKGRVEVVFGKVSLLSMDKVMALLKNSAGRVSLNPVKPECLFMDTGEVSLKEKSQFIKERLESLQGSVRA